MATVTFAFVVATALFFLFSQTRWMGVIGVFVLLCIHPFLVTALLVVIGASIYFIFYRSNQNVLKFPKLPFRRR